MRKLLITFMLLCLPIMALAEAFPQEIGSVPAEVQAMLEDYHGTDLSTDYLEFALSDGRRVSIAVSGGYSVEGFEFAEGEWKYILMTSVTQELRPAYLERIPGDVPAFHLTKEDNTARMTYRYDGEQFALVGWIIPGYRPVTAQGDVLTYGEGSNAFRTVLPGGVTNWPWAAEDLPLTPDTALALAAITEQNVRDMFPGYTLQGYSAYNDGFMAEAVYSRIDSNGFLHIRRAFLKAGLEAQFTDCMPIPLSEQLLTRLETEPFDSLISCWGTGDTFLTQDAFCRESLALPHDAVIRDNVVQEHSVIVLCEVEGMRYLYVWETDGQGYAVRRSQPLPGDAYLDLFHAGDGVIQLEWAEQNMSASFSRREDGQWLLSWCTCYGPSMDTHFSANAFGVTWFDVDGSEKWQVGTLDSSDLFTIRIGDLEGARPALDRTGWAVVSNPNPADRLHLRTDPSRSSRSQGKFYSGTPVRILNQKGDWTKVVIGFGTTARTGWMMTKYLVSGDAMDDIVPAFPQLTYREEYASNDRLGGSYWVAGVFEEGTPKQYILLGCDGDVLYVPQHQLFEGNG